MANDQGHHTWVEQDAPIRVAVVDDHELVRSGICNALSLSPDLQVAGEAGDGQAALELLGNEPVDVVLLDLHMPRMDGFACLDAISTGWPDVSVIILTVDDDKETAIAAMKRGAAAYVPKFVKPGDLVSLVRQVATGSVMMGGHALTGALAGNGGVESPGATSGASQHGLTGRELEVLVLVSAGKTNAEIARALFITVKTVKYHLTTIFSKLGVHNRTELAAFAIIHGLTASGPDSSGASVR